MNLNAKLTLVNQNISKKSELALVNLVGRLLSSIHSSMALGI